MQEIKYEKAAGEIPAKGEMEKRQVNCLQRENAKAAGELPAKGKMKKQQADACNLCDQ